MGENDSKSASSGSHTIPNEAIDQGSTVELDRYSIMKRVQQDLGLTDNATVQMPVQNHPAEVEEDNKATQQLPAISEQTVVHGADAQLLQAMKGPEMNMHTLDVVLEPISAISGTVTTPFATRIEFEAVVQEGGWIQIPDVFVKGGHVRKGTRIKIIADLA